MSTFKKALLRSFNGNWLSGVDTVVVVVGVLVVGLRKGVEGGDSLYQGVSNWVNC